MKEAKKEKQPSSHTKPSNILSFEADITHTFYNILFMCLLLSRMDIEEKFKYKKRTSLLNFFFRFVKKIFFILSIIKT